MPPAKAASPFNSQDGVALREHLEARIDALEKLADMQLASLAKETSLADSVLRAQWEGGHSEALRQIKVLGDRMDALESYRDQMQGKASQSSVIVALVFAVPALILSIIELIRMLGGG